MSHIMKKESNQIHEYLPFTPPQGECNSSVDCNTEFDIIVTNQPITFNDTLKNAIEKDNDFLDLYTAKKRENFNISYFFDYNGNNPVFDVQPLQPLQPHIPQGECNSSVDCNTEFNVLEPITVTNELKAFDSALKDTILKDNDFLDLYTAKKGVNFNISYLVDHNSDVSDNPVFDVQPLQPHIPQGECNSSVDCNTEFNVLEPITVSNEPKTFDSALEDAILKDNDFPDLYTAKKMENFNISYLVDHNGNISDDPVFDVQPLQPHTPQGESVDCNTEFNVLEPITVTNELNTFDSALKDAILKDNDFLDLYTAKKGVNLNISYLVDHNSNVSDNPVFNVQPLQPHIPQGECNSSVDCNTEFNVLEPITVANEPNTFDSALKDAILTDNDLLDLYTAKKGVNFNISYLVDHNSNVSDNPVFNVQPLQPHTPQGECNSSVDCNTELFNVIEPITVANEPKTFDSALKDTILKDNDNLDLYTAKKMENFNIFHSVDHNANISDNSNFSVQPLRPHTDEIESNTEKSEPLLPSVLPSQCLASFYTEPHNTSVDCNTKELLVQREYGDDILKDVIVKEEELPGPFYAKIAKYFANIYKCIQPNVSGKAKVLENSNFVEDSYRHRTQSTTFERFQHEMHPKIKDATAMDVDNNLCRKDDNIGIEGRINQIPLAKEAFHLSTPTVCSQAKATATEIDIDYNLRPEDGNIEIEVQPNQMPLIEEAGYLITVCNTSSLLPRNDSIESTVGLEGINDSFSGRKTEKDATVIDVDNNLCREDDNIGIEGRINQIPLAKEAFHLSTPTEYSQTKATVTEIDIDYNLRPEDDNIGIEVQTNQMPLVEEAGYPPTVCNTPSLLPRNDSIESTVGLEAIATATAIDIDYNLRSAHDNIELETNQMPLAKDVEHLTTVCSTLSLLPRNDVIESTVCLQDVPKEITDDESYDEHNRITTEESDAARGSNDKDNFKIVKSQDECEKESIHIIKTQSGTLKARKDKNSTFKIKRSFQNHKRSDEQKQFVCETCNRSFKRKYDLMRHSNGHREHKPYICDICDKSFPKRQNILVHLGVHTGAKPFVCNVCQKSFRLQSTFVYHSYSHTGKKPYVCNVCQKGFSQSGNLRIHSYLHTGERPFKCKVCGNSYTTKGNLLQHSKVHLD